MATRPPTPDPDPRADEYRRIYAAPPTPAHVAALRRLGMRIPSTQREASALLNAAARAGLEVR